jgi:hypothetical protein
MPRSLIKFKPDWDMADEDTLRASDYYKSDRALGHLYRGITLEDIPDALPPHQGNPEAHPISKVLDPLVRRHCLPGSLGHTPTTWIESLYVTYREELAYISSAFSLSKAPGFRLREEELVIGTILAKSTHKGYRTSRLRAMRENMGFLVQDVKEQLVGRLEGLSESALKERLAVAWDAWRFSLAKATSEKFGPESFGLIGLGLVLDCLERLGSEDWSRTTQQVPPPADCKGGLPIKPSLPAPTPSRTTLPPKTPPLRKRPRPPTQKSTLQSPQHIPSPESGGALLHQTNARIHSGHTTPQEDPRGPTSNTAPRRRVARARPPPPSSTSRPSPPGPSP